MADSQETASQQVDMRPPPGPYFFYGTLQDPDMLKSLLDSAIEPVLKPAHVLGFKLRIWSVYPAASITTDANARVLGSMFDVPNRGAAAKLQYYETNNYRPQPCKIHVSDPDTGEKREVDGHIFVFCGNEDHLEEGNWDMDVWKGKRGFNLV